MVKSVTIEVLQTWLNTIKSVHTLQIFLLVDRLDGIQSSLWYLKCHRLDYIPSSLSTPCKIPHLWIHLTVYSQVCNNWNCNRLDCIPSTLSTPRQISHLWIDLTVFSQVCYNCECYRLDGIPSSLFTFSEYFHCFESIFMTSRWWVLWGNDCYC